MLQYITYTQALDASYPLRASFSDPKFGKVGPHSPDAFSQIYSANSWDVPTKKLAKDGKSIFAEGGLVPVEHACGS